MSDISNPRPDGRPRRRPSIGTYLVAALAFGAIAFAATTDASPTYDPNKIVPNASGVSADEAQGSDDCSTETFLSQDRDLWHFVVPDEIVTTGTGSDRERYRLTADITAVIIEWEVGGFGRYEGTDDYDQGNAGTNLIWIYTEPGRTIKYAWLEYTITRDDGEPVTETYLTTPHNLSHACAAALPVPPTISIDSDARYDVLYDLEYQWTIDKSVDPDGLVAAGNDPFLLDYSVDATRQEPPVQGNWRIVDGSMVADGTIILSDATLADVVVTSPGAVCSTSDDAVPDDDNYLWQCIVTDEPAITSSSGLDGTSIAISATVTTAYGTDTDTEELPWGPPDSATLVDTVHATAYIVDGERLTSPSAGPLSLEYQVSWLPELCPDQRVNVAELFDGVTGEPLGVDDTLVITGCPPQPGLTIGYWGNKMGAPQVVAAFPTLKVQYPALAAIPITNEASVRRYMTSANCSGDCTTMFLAQALATAMNARSSTFGDATVLFEGECRTVDEWLDLALRTAIPVETDVRIAYKTLFDDLNNTRATRCASVG